MSDCLISTDFLSFSYSFSENSWAMSFIGFTKLGRFISEPLLDESLSAAFSLMVFMLLFETCLTNMDYLLSLSILRRFCSSSAATLVTDSILPPWSWSYFVITLRLADSCFCPPLVGKFISAMFWASMFLILLSAASSFCKMVIRLLPGRTDGVCFPSCPWVIVGSMGLVVSSDNMPGLMD